jgi:enamine deaminase RidA (YjgF/YER057c/UK114 family)
MAREELRNPNLPNPRGYSRAVRAPKGRLVFTSMTAPVGPDGQTVGGGAAEQARRALINVQDVLSHNGGSLDDVVKLTAFITRSEDAAAVMAVMGETFVAPPPAMALAIIAALPDPAFLVEMEAVAVVAEPAT